MYFTGDIVPPRFNCKSNFVKDLVEMFSLLLYNLFLEVYMVLGSNILIEIFEI